MMIVVKQNLEGAWAAYEWEIAHKCHLRPKTAWWLHNLIGAFWPGWSTDWWTTLRKPTEAWPTVWYPSHLSPGEAATQISILDHELVHVAQQRTLQGLVRSVLLATLLPLPILFSGRWFLERHAFLRDINRGRYTVDQAVTVLWQGYGWCWPKTYMRIWFLQRLADQATDEIDTTELG